MTDTNVTQLIINKLTKAQYDALQDKSETELYIVPDEIDDTPTSGSENPVTSDGIKTALDAKQDTLVSGTNVKTINGLSLLGSGDLDVKDVFIAEYGVTSAQDTWNAVQAGKVVIVKRANFLYYPEYSSNTTIRFVGFGYENYIMFFDLTSTAWSTNVSFTWQKTADRVSTITGNIDTTKYPNTKAVADYAQPIIDSSNKLSADLVDDTGATHKFVTSAQTETWDTVTEKAPLPFVVTVMIGPEGVVTNISHTISEIDAAYSANKQLRLKCTNAQQGVWFEEDLTQIWQTGGSYFYVSHTVTDEGVHYIITIYDDSGTTKAKFEMVDDKAYAKYYDVLINSITPTIASSTVTIDGYTIYPSEETFVVKPYQKITFSDTNGDCRLYIIDATNPDAKTVISHKIYLITWDNQSDSDVTIQVGIDNRGLPGTLGVNTYWRGTDNVFVAEYGVTSVSEIESAVDSGRVVMCRAIEDDNIVYYQLSQSSSTSFTFFRFVSARYYRIALNKSTGVWNASDDLLQSTSNRDSAIDSSASATHYPSSKAVYEYVNGIVGNINSILETI